MDIQPVTVVIAGISVIIVVINSVRSNRRADEQRQVQLVSQIYNRLHEKDFVTQFYEMIYQWDFRD
jgi:type II secretory pathway pseudopilin PulG